MRAWTKGSFSAREKAGTRTRLRVFTASDTVVEPADAQERGQTQKPHLGREVSGDLAEADGGVRADGRLGVDLQPRKVPQKIVVHELRVHLREIGQSRKGEERAKIRLGR